MGNKKISQLSNGSTLAGVEYVPIVQNGVTVKTTAQAIANLGGGSTPTLITKSITSNGTYNASSDNADGYSSVTVNVSGGGSSVTFTPVKEYLPSGIGANGWTATDGTSTLNIDGGTYSASAGNYVEVDASNQLRMSMPISGSFYAFAIKCEIDPTFSPVNTNNWYAASCILGQELGGEQCDFAVIIDKNGYFALGYATASILSTSVSALDGNVHELVIMPFGMDQVRLFIDGVEQANVTYGMRGNQMTNIGVFWNKDNGNSRVNGKIYDVGYFSVNYTMTIPSF